PRRDADRRRLRSVGSGRARHRETALLLGSDDGGAPANTRGDRRPGSAWPVPGGRSSTGRTRREPRLPGRALTLRRSNGSKRNESLEPLVARVALGAYESRAGARRISVLFPHVCAALRATLPCGLARPYLGSAAARGHRWVAARRTLPRARRAARDAALRRVADTAARLRESGRVGSEPIRPRRPLARKEIQGLA